MLSNKTSSTKHFDAIMTMQFTRQGQAQWFPGNQKAKECRKKQQRLPNDEKNELSSKCIYSYKIIKEINNLNKRIIDYAEREQKSVESRKIKGGYTDPQTDEAAPPKQTPKAQSAPVSEEPRIIASNDNAAIVEALDADTRKIYELLPDGKAFTLDSVNADGADVGAIMTALTVLEISGLVESRPGGAYLKK